MALITLIPLVWLLAVTMTAGVQKIWHSDPRIGFLAQARVQAEQIASAEAVVAQRGQPEMLRQAAKAEHQDK